MKIFKTLLKIVTDYRLNANHNASRVWQHLYSIVTDYRLNANHNSQHS
ncbi:Helicase loader DnaI [uncultured Candidatus Thioglobus sp.]|nr:Helicase loader DnaI [uncultured Candidatus Thioglobus sp.]